MTSEKVRNWEKQQSFREDRSHQLQSLPRCGKKFGDCFRQIPLAEVLAVRRLPLKTIVIDK